MADTIFDTGVSSGHIFGGFMALASPVTEVVEDPWL